MRKLFENARKEVSQFISQRDDLAMFVSCSHNDAGIALQILRDIEQANATDIFLLFADNFIQAGPFVDVTIERLREQHSLACEALAAKGREPLPQFPANLSDQSLPPEVRLQRAMSFARSLLPRDEGHRLVWAMFPQRIADRREYLRLAGSFVPREGVRPWMAGIRLLFRDETGTAEYAPELANASRVRLMNLDLGPAAIEASTQSDVNDEEMPVEERMQALLSLAFLDYAHNRNDEAIAKYCLLLGHYQKAENPVMQAVVINAFGDIYHRRGELDQALHWYECAVPPAAAAKDPIILSTITRNLGDVAYKQGCYSNAEHYYDGVDKLSAITLDPGSKIRALEWRGLSQEKQGKHDEAIGSWEAAALLSRKMQITPLLRENLSHLERGYGNAGQKHKAESVKASLKEIELAEVER